MSPAAVLAIETATAQVGVALARSGGQVFAFEEGGERRHAETLAPAIQSLCQQAQVSLADLGAVAVDVGPGLFTGLRVGLATAKAISYACSVPLVGITSLEILAHQALSLLPAPPPSAVPHIVANVDARRSEIFYAVYQADPDLTDPALTCIAAPEVASPAELAAALAPDQPYFFIGDGLARHPEHFAALGPAQNTAQPTTTPSTTTPSTTTPSTTTQPVAPAAVGLNLQHHQASPSAEVLARLAQARAAQGEFTAPEQLLPLYLRAPDAQVNWESRVRA